jgi:hypothetical protein
MTPINDTDPATQQALRLATRLGQQAASRSTAFRHDRAQLPPQRLTSHLLAMLPQLVRRTPAQDEAKRNLLSNEFLVGQ